MVPLKMYSMFSRQTSGELSSDKYFAIYIMYIVLQASTIFRMGFIVSYCGFNELVQG